MLMEGLMMQFLPTSKRTLTLLTFMLVGFCSLADCYDPLDPDGNITVTFDTYKWTTDGYMARVTIENYYQYRHVERPGWKIGWIWARNEVIWSITGAVAIQQGNCSAFKEDPIPHSCRKDPTIVDLQPDAMPEMQTENCCHSGILSARAIDPSKTSSSFEIKVGNLASNSSGNFPQNLTLMAPGPGYTCGSFMDDVPTVSPVTGGIREEQVFRTWKSICTYSPFVANKAPTCCVSLSTFYNSKITPCPSCSCGCRVGDESATSCLSENFLLGGDISDLENVLRCTDHMCPIRVHWHVKTNYRNHWRVKVTVSNYNFGVNYSDWNILVQHPGLSSSPIIYSFNSTLLPTVGIADEVALLWGITNYNQMLIHASDKQDGSVQTDILMGKDADSFTFSNGWALPRRIYFNGENCEMPSADDFPTLPNSISRLHARYHLFFIFIALCFSFRY